MKVLNSENDRFKVVAQCLMEKMEESGCCNMEKHSIDSDKNDTNSPIVLLEVSGTRHVLRQQSTNILHLVAIVLCIL